MPDDIITTLLADLAAARVDQRNAILRGDTDAVSKAADRIVQIEKLLRMHGHKP